METMDQLAANTDPALLRGLGWRSFSLGTLFASRAVHPSTAPPRGLELQICAAIKWPIILFATSWWTFYHVNLLIISKRHKYGLRNTLMLSLQGLCQGWNPGAPSSWCRHGPIWSHRHPHRWQQAPQPIRFKGLAALESARWRPPCAPWWWNLFI